VKVLVPGVGMGRLAFDIAMEGFECQGSELVQPVQVPGSGLL
jgi:hypothetical protein